MWLVVWVCHNWANVGDTYLCVFRYEGFPGRDLGRTNQGREWSVDLKRMFWEQSKQKCGRKSSKIKDPWHEQKCFSGAVRGRPTESSLSYSSACTSGQSLNHWDQIQMPCHRYLFSYFILRISPVWTTTAGYYSCSRLSKMESSSVIGKSSKQIQEETS